MIRVDVIIKDKSWNRYLKKPEKYFNKRLGLINKKITYFKKKKFNFSIMLAGNFETKRLNNYFRKKNKTTDVLSFPYNHIDEQRNLIKKKNKLYLGDVILNLYKIKKNEKESFYDNLDKIWIHGLLHLLGHAHEKNKDYKKMNKEEKKFFSVVTRLNDK